MVASVLRFDHPGIRKHGWQLFYSFLASWFNTSDWLFMNYGYAGGPNEAELCPEDEPHRCFIQMYAHTLRLAGSVAGRDVLEVGCGRGGGCSWIARTQSVRSMTGVDLAGSAIALCKRTHRVSNLRFEQGDAEDLAFPDASFHVVVNVESCHHYPSLPRLSRMLSAAAGVRAVRAKYGKHYREVPWPETPSDRMFGTRIRDLLETLCR